MLRKGRLRMLVTLSWLFLVGTRSSAGEVLSITVFLFRGAIVHLLIFNPCCSADIDLEDDCDDMKLMGLRCRTFTLHFYRLYCIRFFL